MKPIYYFILLILISFTRIQAQTNAINTIALNQSDSLCSRAIVEESDYIIGGVGVSYECFYDENKVIYTSIIFEVRHIFRGKGIQLGTIEIIQLGGSIGSDDQYDRHERGYGLENPTILFCKKSDFVFTKRNDKTLDNIQFALKQVKYRRIERNNRLRRK
jgi:hypothetical protein